METLHVFDFSAATIGLIYIWLEYKANIWMWIVGIIMPAIDIFVYYKAGLYADSGMAVYYTLAAIYGFCTWKFFKEKKQECRNNPSKESEEMPITHYKQSHILPSVIAFVLAWFSIYELLIHFSNSNIPVMDSFINALSIIALWALSRKYIEQWILWIIIDAIFCGLAFYKGLIFKPCLYGLYVIIAVFGYFKWQKLM